VSDHVCMSVKSIDFASFFDIWILVFFVFHFILYILYISVLYSPDFHFLSVSITFFNILTIHMCVSLFFKTFR
jgi:hypothetical protein